MAVNWAFGEDHRVRIDGKGIIDIAIYEKDDALVVFLVNLTNPMMMKGPLREVYPIGTQTLSVALPKGKRSAVAKMLVKGQECTCRIVGDRVEVEVPSVEAMETVHLTWHS